jgi:hypothetical protein
VSEGLEVTEAGASCGDVGKIWKGAQVAKKAVGQPCSGLLSININ